MHSIPGQRMYLGGGTLERQPRILCSRELAYCSEDWNGQPIWMYSINAFNISKVCDICPESIFNDEDRLYKFEDVYSIDQTFQVRAVIGKCKAVQVYISCFVNFRKLWRRGVTHKLEPKVLQVIHSSWGLRGPNWKKCHINDPLKIGVLIHTCGPELIVMDKIEFDN